MTTETETYLCGIDGCEYEGKSKRGLSAHRAQKHRPAAAATRPAATVVRSETPAPYGNPMPAPAPVALAIRLDGSVDVLLGPGPAALAAGRALSQYEADMSDLIAATTERFYRRVGAWHRATESQREGMAKSCRYWLEAFGAALLDKANS